MLALLHKHPLTTFIMSIPIIFFPFNLHTIFENSTKKKYWEDERLYNINDRCNFYSQSINSQQLICLWLMEEVEACKEEGNSTHWWCSSLNSAGWSPWTAKSPQTRRSRTKSERQWRERRCRLHKESPQHKSGMRKSCPSAGLSAKQLSLLSSDLMAVSPCFPLLSLPFFFFLFSKVSQKTDSYKLTQKLSFPRSPTNYYLSTITWKQENPQVGFLLSFPLFFISLVMMIREQEIMVPAPHGQRNENSKAVSFNPAVKEYRCTHLSCAPPSSSSNCKKLMKFSITFPSAEPKREQHMDGYWKTS